MVRWAALGLVVCGCATLGAGPKGPQVTALKVEFAEPLVGLLEFEVMGAPEFPSVEVGWQLWLDGHLFAQGVDAHPSRGESGGLRVSVPLAWRHLGWREGPRYTQVRVLGDVRPSGGLAGAPFEVRREVMTAGAPVVDVLRE